MASKLSLPDVLPFLAQADRRDVLRFVQTDDRSLVPFFPDEIIDDILSNDELKTDLFWFLEISEEVRVDEYACVHLAYASTDHLNKIITKENGLYTLAFDPVGKNSIVIEHCPWCGTKLNTALAAKDAAIETWLLNEVVPTIAAIAADPSRASSIEDARKRLHARIDRLGDKMPS